MTELTGKTAFVTGGASGIGRSIAKLVIARGGTAIISDINPDGVNATGEEIGAESHILDVSDIAAIDALADQVWNAHGGIDLVFANAGVSAGGGSLLKATEQQFDHLFGVNVKGAWATSVAFARKMVAEKRRGHICITGSENSLGYLFNGNGLYNGSKHAILGIADVLRHELPETITVSLLCPGLTATGLTGPTAQSGLPQPPDQVRAFTKEVMARGQDPDIVAEKALRGTLDGDFIIPAISIIRDCAEQRWKDIEAGFAKHAPPNEDEYKFLVTNVVKDLRGQS